MRWGLRASPRDLVHEAIAALRAHRLRTSLSIVGIVVGIATVVTALAIGEGARQAALTEIGALGIDNVLLRAAVPQGDAGRRQLPVAPLLSLEDAAVIADTLDAAAVAAIRTAPVEILAAGRQADGLIAGVTVPWHDVVRVEIAAGRWLTGADERAQRRVAVLGGSLARQLFGDDSPVGRQVKTGGNWYHVVGQLEHRSQGSARPVVAALDIDRAIFVPLRAMDISLGAGDAPNRVQEIAVRLNAPEDVELAAQVIGAIAARRHRVTPPVHQVVVPRELLRARLRAQRTFNTVLIAIGALALFISGIGIMNIMLASVAERTQEIGVRRAFGARRRDVIVQFGFEAVLLCAVGGAMGVPLGALLSTIVAVTADWPLRLSPGAVALSLALSTTVGLVFGLYPAQVAANVSPADALRAA